jgi:NADH:ubiquinone oxidoreductase subunit 3 (subunit A)
VPARSPAAVVQAVEELPKWVVPVVVTLAVVSVIVIVGLVLLWWLGKKKKTEEDSDDVWLSEIRYGVSQEDVRES